MTEEQINKIRDIENLGFHGSSKEELNNVCELIVSVWDLEEDQVVKDAIAVKLNTVMEYIFDLIPDNHHKAA